MRPVHIHVVGDRCKMCDNKPGRGSPARTLPPVQEFANHPADQLHVLDVNARIRLIQHHKIRVLRHQLQYLGPFYLASREPGVHIPLKEFLCEMHFFRKNAGLIGDITGFIATAEVHHLPEPDAAYDRRVLECDPHPEFHALSGRQVGYVLAIEDDPAAGHPVSRKPEYTKQERRLSRSVGT